MELYRRSHQDQSLGLASQVTRKKSEQNSEESDRRGQRQILERQRARPRRTATRAWEGRADRLPPGRRSAAAAEIVCVPCLAFSDCVCDRLSVLVTILFIADDKPCDIVGRVVSVL